MSLIRVTLLLQAAGAVAFVLIGLAAYWWGRRRRAAAASSGARSFSPSHAVPDCWRHQSIVLRMGKHVYPFRTLSFGDALDVWQHVPGLVKAVRDGKDPVGYIEHLVPVLRIVQPTLLTEPDDIRLGFTKENVQTIWHWYAQQNWGRMKDLAGGDRPKAAPDGETPQLSQRTVFLTVAQAAAVSIGLSVEELLAARFELAADAIISLRERYEKVKGEDGTMTADQFRSVAAGMLGENRVDQTTAPEWLKAMVSHATHGRVC